jgi:hypothetical protein
MSFIKDALGGLFGGGKVETPMTPRATPAAPRVGDAAGESAVRAERARRRNVSEDETILTGLGSVGSPGAQVKRSTLLGSAATAT